MPHVGFILDGSEFSFEDCLRMAELGEIPTPLPLLRLLMPKRNDTQPSPSSLANCLRRFELQRTTDYYTSLFDGLASTFGTSVHQSLADAAKRHSDELGDVECTLSADVYLDLPAPYDKITLRGTADFVSPTERLVRDWKSKRYLPAGFTVPNEHKAQVNVYAWLYYKATGCVLDKYELVYFDQSKVKRFTGFLQSPDVTERWIKQRLTQWAEPVSRGTIPAPLPEFNPTKPAGPCAYCPVLYACKKRFEGGE